METSYFTSSTSNDFLGNEPRRDNTNLTMSLDEAQQLLKHTQLGSSVHSKRKQVSPFQSPTNMVVVPSEKEKKLLALPPLQSLINEISHDSGSNSGSSRSPSLFAHPDSSLFPSKQPSATLAQCAPAPDEKILWPQATNRIPTEAILMENTETIVGVSGNHPSMQNISLQENGAYRGKMNFILHSNEELTDVHSTSSSGSSQALPSSSSSSSSTSSPSDEKPIIPTKPGFSLREPQYSVGTLNNANLFLYSLAMIPKLDSKEAHDSTPDITEKTANHLIQLSKKLGIPAPISSAPSETPKEGGMNRFYLFENPNKIQRKSYKKENRCLLPNPLIVCLRPEFNGEKTRVTQGQVSVKLVSNEGEELPPEKKNALASIESGGLSHPLDDAKATYFSLKIVETSDGQLFKLQFTVTYELMGESQPITETFTSSPFAVYSNKHNRKKKTN